MLGDAPGDGAFDGDYYDGPGPGLAAMMPQLNPAAALESLLFNADPSLLLSIPSPPPTSTPLLCRMFPNTVRCLQYRFPFTGETPIAPRVDAAPEPLAPTPEDGPEEQQPQMQQQMQQQAPNYPPPLSYQYVLLGVPNTAAVHPVVAPYEPCRVGFDEQQQQQVYDQQPQQQQQQQLPQVPQQPVNRCPGAQKLPQAASTQNVVVAQQAGVEKTPAAKAPEVVQVTPAQSSV